MGPALIVGMLSLCPRDLRSGDPEVLLSQNTFFVFCLAPRKSTFW